MSAGTEEVNVGEVLGEASPQTSATLSPTTAHVPSTSSDLFSSIAQEKRTRASANAANLAVEQTE